MSQAIIEKLLKEKEQLTLEDIKKIETYLQYIKEATLKSKTLIEDKNKTNL